MGIISKVKKALAAHLLERHIRKAVCDYAPQSIDWLFIHNRPSINEIVQPEMGGFIHCCRVLGINWRLLRKSLKSAFEVVPTSELEYNDRYEIRDSKRCSKDNEVQRRVRSKIVPFAPKRSKAH